MNKTDVVMSQGMCLTCSGVAVMGLGMLEACVAAGVGGPGLGVPAADEAGARYFNTAGSTSGVPCVSK